MNVYEANNITIPDGSVKRILDMNGVVLWGKKSDPTEPFYVKNISQSPETLTITKPNGNNTYTIEYSTNKTTWNTLGTITKNGSLTRTLNPGDKVYLRVDTRVRTSSSAGMFTITGVSKVGGNTMSLIYGSSFTGNETTLYEGGVGYYQECFGGLFNNNTHLISANDLLLPATTLISYCYRGMFYDCTSLVTIPNLPATTLATQCYGSMFSGCSALVNASKIEIVSTANQCCWNMFHSCPSLVNPPSITATGTSSECFAGMFVNCISLEKAPYLPATNIASDAYVSMFNGCSNLKEIRCNATNGGTNSTTKYWVGGVAPSGIFYKNANVSWRDGDIDDKGAPSGWTIVDL